MDPKSPEYEQALATLRDSIPRTWWSVYQGSKAVGFTHEQAFSLLHTYILSQGRNSVKPGDVHGTSDTD